MDIASYDTEQIAVYLERLFLIGDTNGDGVLQPQEFADLLNRSGFNFPPHLILRMVRDADLNEDGVIQFEEFVPVMLDLIQKQAMGQLPPPPPPERNMRSWRDVDPVELEQYLKRLFLLGDTNGNGVLEPTEVIDLLLRSGLNFPSSVVLDGFLAADINEDGVLDYEEFIVMFLSLLDELLEIEGSLPPEPEPDTKAPLKPSDYSDEQLEEYFKKLFQIADKNGDGVLQPPEFELLLQTSGFQFDQEMIERMFDQVDTNHDGVIEYSEFLHMMAPVARGEEYEEQALNPEEYTEEELQEYFSQIFQIADANGDGVLQPEEVRKLLDLCGFGFDDATLSRVMAAADINNDGVIEYEEFVPLMCNLINQYAEQQPDTQASKHSEEDLTEYFKQIFQMADQDGNGVLDPMEFTKLLTMSGLNLSATTILEIIRQADINHDGVIEYDEFVDSVASLAKMDGRNCPKQEVDIMESVAWHQLEGVEFEQYLSRLFQIGDQNGDGVLQPMEFLELMCLSGQRFPDDMILKLFLGADLNHDGVIDYNEYIAKMKEVIREHQTQLGFRSTEDKPKTWQYRVFVPVNNKSRGALQRVKRRVVADQIGRRTGKMGVFVHQDAFSGGSKDECTEKSGNDFPVVSHCIARDANGAEQWAQAKAQGTVRTATVHLETVTERYMLGGCLAEMSFVLLHEAHEVKEETKYVRWSSGGSHEGIHQFSFESTGSALEQAVVISENSPVYATFMFEGKTPFTVYEAAEALDIGALAPYAICGDQTAETLLGCMATSYAGFVALSPQLETPPGIAPSKVKALQASTASSAVDDLQMAGPLPDLTSVSPAVLQRYLQRLFSVADQDGSGDLDYYEFSHLLRSSGFNLDRDVRRRIMASVTIEAGRIKYEQYVPVVMDILGVPLRNQAAQGVTPGRKPLDLSAYTADVLEEYLQRLFMKGDKNADGVLSPDELEMLLGASGFAFSAVFIKEMIEQCDLNHDGVIDYAEFVPMMTQLICS